MDFESLVSELYGVPLDAFTDTRNTQVKQARVDGDAVLARKVQGLRKPTLAAWLVNQLMRRHGQDVQVLLDLGREMRAGLTGLTAEELRLLTKRRHQLVAALVADAIGLAGGRRAGGPVEAAVRSTLEATLADPGSAEAVMSGRLTEPLEVSGFAAVGIEGGAWATPTSEHADADVVDLTARRDRRTKAMERAEAAVATAEKASRKAHARREKADVKRLAAAKQAREATALATSLEQQLESASVARDDAQLLADRKQEKADEAEAVASQADRALAEARQQLRELTR